MKKYYLIASIGFILFSCSKNITYVNSNNEILTKSQIKSLDKGKVYFEEFETDSMKVRKVYPIKRITKIDSVQLLKIQNFLKNIVGENFDENKATMIHLYRKNDQVKNDTNYDRYWNYINKHANRYQSFLIGTRNSQIEIDPEKNIYRDPINFFENSFFKESRFNINHLFFDPDGNVYIYFGMEDILNVLDWSV